MDHGIIWRKVVVMELQATWFALDEELSRREVMTMHAVRCLPPAKGMFAAGAANQWR